MKSAIVVIACLCSLLVCTGASLPLGDECSKSMVDNFRLSPRDFAGKLLACQIRGNPDEHCCGLTRSLFGEGGVLDKCLCAPSFLSMVLDSVPNAGIMPEFALNMWKQCGIPVTGEAQCPGTEEGPAVTGQGLVAKTLGAKALLAKALTKPSLVGGLLGGHSGYEETEETYEEPEVHSHEEYYVQEGSHVHYVTVAPAVVEVAGPPVEVPVPVPTPVEVPGPPVEVPVPVPTPVEVPGPPVEVPVPVPTPVEVPGPPVEVPVPVPGPPVEVPGPPVEVPVPVPGPPVEVPVPVETPVEVPVPVETPVETPLPAAPQAPLDVTIDVSTSSFIPPPGEDKLTGGMKLENGGDAWHSLNEQPTVAVPENGDAAQGFVDTSTEQFVDTSAQQEFVDTPVEQSVDTSAQQDVNAEQPAFFEQTAETPEVVVEQPVQDVAAPVEVPETAAGSEVTAEGSATAEVQPAAVVGHVQDPSLQGAVAGRRLRFM